MTSRRSVTASLSGLAAQTPAYVGMVGAASFGLSGLAFLLAVLYLYRAEGPGSPDVPVTLAQPQGQQLFFGLVTAGTIAVLLSVVGMVALVTCLRARNPFALLLVLVLQSMAGAIFIGFLSLQYALAMIGKEGATPTDPTFHELALLAHAAADLGGWTSIAIFALSTLIISLVVRRLPRWTVASSTGLVIAALAPILFLLSISYLFTIPFGLWEIVLAATLLRTRHVVDAVDGRFAVAAVAGPRP